MAATKTPHVAVIAFPFASHPKSLHSVVVRLARSSPNTLFTFITTPTANASLFNNANNKTQNPPNLKPYDLDDGVPAGQNAAELSFDKAVEPFYVAMVRPGNVKRQLDAAASAAAAEITCLLSDAVLSMFLTDALDELPGVPWIAVGTMPIWLLSAYTHTDIIRRRCAEVAAADGDAAAANLELDFIPGLAGMRVSDYKPIQIFHGDLEDERCWLLRAMARLGQLLPRASALVLNSFRELNPDELNRDMESKYRTLLQVGFYTVSVSPSPPQSDQPDVTGCLAWLDGHETNSVAYISFGTMAALSENEMKAMAEALEETETPFLWSLPSDQKKLLPSGFEEKTQRHGRIVAWTNQARVLGHDSVGVYVAHCGSNSLNESVANGVPIIAKPFWADNQMNAKMVERVRGMGVRVNEGGVLTKNGFIEALEKVLKQEEGKKMRERALALKKLALEASSPTGSGTRDFNTLLGLISAVL